MWDVSTEKSVIPVLDWAREPTATARTTSVTTRRRLVADFREQEQKNRTSMAFQYLQHFAGLQIPYIYLGILTATNDVLAFRVAEACKQTKGTIGMPRVCLDTTRSLIIPESYR